MLYGDFSADMIGWIAFEYAGRLAKNANMTGQVLLNGRHRKLSYGAVVSVCEDPMCFKMRICK